MFVLLTTGVTYALRTYSSIFLYRAFCLHGAYNNVVGGWPTKDLARLTLMTWYCSITLEFPYLCCRKLTGDLMPLLYPINHMRIALL